MHDSSSSEPHWCLDLPCRGLGKLNDVDTCQSYFWERDFYLRFLILITENICNNFLRKNNLRLNLSNLPNSFCHFICPNLYIITKNICLLKLQTSPPHYALFWLKTFRVQFRNIFIKFWSDSDVRSLRTTRGEIRLNALIWKCIKIHVAC